MYIYSSYSAMQYAYRANCLANYITCISYVICRIKVSLGQYDVGTPASRYTHKCNDKQNCHFRQCKN